MSDWGYIMLLVREHRVEQLAAYSDSMNAVDTRLVYDVIRYREIFDEVQTAEAKRDLDISLRILNKHVSGRSSDRNWVNELESQIPPLNIGDGNWKKATELEGHDKDCLKSARSRGLKAPDGMFGIHGGMIWRKEKPSSRNVWYFFSRNIPGA